MRTQIWWHRPRRVAEALRGAALSLFCGPALHAQDLWDPCPYFSGAPYYDFFILVLKKVGPFSGLEDFLWL